MFLLEYSDKQGCFHCNYLNPNGEFAANLFVNDYRPITLISDDMLSEKWFLKAQDNVMRTKTIMPFEQAAEFILKEIWKNTNKEEKENG